MMSQNQSKKAKLTMNNFFQYLKEKSRKRERGQPALFPTMKKLPMPFFSMLHSGKM